LLSLTISFIKFLHKTSHRSQLQDSIKKLRIAIMEIFRKYRFLGDGLIGVRIREIE
jgi:hypothetical protein